MVASDCSAAGRCGPVRRVFGQCDARPACTPSADQPSQLNIMLTTEIIELRKQVEELQAAAEAQSKELEQLASDLAATGKLIQICSNLMCPKDIQRKVLVINRTIYIYIYTYMNIEIKIDINIHISLYI